MNRARLLDRVKKLLRLAASPNEHEAARAADTARRLMEKYEIAAAEVQDAVIQLADDQRTSQRIELATLVALVYHVDMLTRPDAIAFRGNPTDAGKAVALYQHLAIHCQAHCEPVDDGPRHLYPNPAVARTGSTVWQMFFWSGFTSAVRERLRPAPAREPAPAQSLVMQGPPKTPVVDEIEAALEEFAQCWISDDVREGLESLTADAYNTGRQHGQSVTIENTPQETIESRIRGELVSSDER